MIRSSAHEVLTQAAECMRTAEAELKAAMIAADQASHERVFRNEIARIVGGIYSRQKVLDLLDAAGLLAEVQVAAAASSVVDQNSVRLWLGSAARVLVEITCAATPAGADLDLSRRDIARHLSDLLSDLALDLVIYHPKDQFEGQMLPDVLGCPGVIAEIRRVGDDREGTAK